ncbi:sortilin [Pyxicephalus adspersus]|uniref:sortilin n=1 Tax=Pyxicephalus adspersus TaxID=30357 RepID=UPI003B59DA69
MGCLNRGYILRLLLFTVKFAWCFYPRDQLDDRTTSWHQEGSGNPRVRRSLGSEVLSGTDDGTCTPLMAFSDILRKDTYPATFDASSELSLVWVGDESGIILVLTTFRLPLIIISYGQSKLYRSDDYGKTYQEITDLIKNTYIRTEFGMGLGPENSGRVVLVGEVSGGSHGGRIFRSSDYAKTFVQTELPFHPLRPVSYSPEDPTCLLLISIHYELWISRNFGETWKLIHESVCAAKWGPKNMIFFTVTSTNESCSHLSGAVWSLTMKITNDFGQTFKVLKDHVHSFGLWGRFLLASVMEEDRLKRKIYVSQDHGDTWNVAQLPSVTQEQFYSVLAANDNLIFIHVDDGDTGCGTIYTSDDRGIVYSKSLERHLYTKTGGETDFTNVTSLHGVFITSVLGEDNSVHSVISFDQGGEWNHIRKPENAECDSTTKDNEKCSLHIHGQYSISQKLAVPLPPMSEPNAVGIIIAHGSVGDAVSVASPSVYLSDNGGYSWNRILDGPHHYAILDSGGLIMAVEQRDVPIGTIKTLTLGDLPGSPNMQAAHTAFPPEPPVLNWLQLTQSQRHPKATKSGSVALGQQSLRFLQAEEGEDKDYISWLAHSTDPEAPSDGCVLGYKERYLRLRKSSVCQNGRDYLVSSQPESCVCTLDDYMCDFGYFRKENESTCEEQPEFQGHELELCIYGEEEKLKTNGYRKIPGDKCTGGVNPTRQEMDMKKKCPNDVQTKMQDNTASSVPVILSVVVVLIVAVAAAFFIIKKYVCGGRFIVHRYSVLRENVDIIGNEHLDSNTGAARRSNGYHDDSDEDLLE